MWNLSSQIIALEMIYIIQILFDTTTAWKHMATMDSLN